MAVTKASKKAPHSSAAGVPAIRRFSITAIIICLSAAVLGAAFLYQRLGRTCVTCALAAPKLKALPQFTPKYKDQLLWGSYRPGLYFGMRARQPKSLQFGLMWFDPDNVETVTARRLRHKASQDDKLQTYGWLRHDGRTYGQQSLVDGPFNISTHLVKAATEGSSRGGDWAVRVHAALADGTDMASSGRRQRLSLVLYMWDEETPARSLRAMPHGKKGIKLQDGAMLLEGSSTSLGDWAVMARQVGSGGLPKVRVNYLAAEVPEEQLAVQLDALTIDALMQTAQRKQALHLYLPDADLPNANLAMVQLSFQLPATFDIVYVSNAQLDVAGRLQQLSGSTLDALIVSRQEAFDRRFDQQLLGGRPLPSSTRRVAMAALSNLVGGMGYFYGSSVIRLPPQQGRPPEEVPYWPEELYTAVPSRSFFPRGFLWDEGFHHLLLRRWDPQLARDSLAHWLDLLNSFGWIPREQILGAEARSRVPTEFVAQHPSHANPPSLLLPIAQMAEAVAAAAKEGRLEGQVGEDEQFLRAAWPRLEAWYQWYNTSQQGPLPGSFRWHGRDADTVKELNPKTLMSGLDDYPRASHPTDEERHLDLLCWMALASKAMATIGEVLALPAGKVRPYQWAADRLADLEHLGRLHWDEERGAYADWGLHTEDVRLVEVEQPGQAPETVRVVDTPPTPQYVPHFGYVSLFPLLMRLIPPTSLSLPHHLDKLTDPSLLWTPHGLRSVAPTSSLYMKHNTPHDRPYWRGPIWVNINFLAASALHHYCGQGVERACGAYGELRQNLLRNLQEQYFGTGYLWEQYRDADGAGLGCSPFTGWTALVALVAAEAY